MKPRRKKLTHKTTIFDYLLIRALVLAATGQDYSAELATARTLARLIERQVTR